MVLAVSPVSDDGVMAVVSQCEHLRVLRLGGHIGVTDRTLVAIGKHLPKLQDLSLWRTEITDRGVGAMVERCNNIRKLDLSSTSISDASLLHIGKHLHHLESLDIGFCSKITEAAVIRLLVECKGLTHLGVQHTSIGDDTLTMLGDPAAYNSTEASPIVSLDLDHTAITSKGLMKLSTGCPALARLSINTAPSSSQSALSSSIAAASGQPGSPRNKTAVKISAAAVEQLLQRCPKLQYLSCHGVRFTSDEFKRLKDRIRSFLADDPSAPAASMSAGTATTGTGSNDPTVTSPSAATTSSSAPASAPASVSSGSTPRAAAAAAAKKGGTGTGVKMDAMGGGPVTAEPAGGASAKGCCVLQ